MREIAIFLVTCRLAKLELFALHRKGDGPRPRIHDRIGDGCLVVESVGIHRRESFHHVLGVAHNLAAFIEPGLAV